MLSRRRKDEPNGQDPSELAALADDSLGPDRRAALEAQVASSSDLADLLSEQQRAVALTRSAAAEVEAPTALRARIEAQRRPHRMPAPRRLVLIGAAAVAVIGIAVGLGVSLTGTSYQRFHAALAGTAFAPGAQGEATLTKTSSGWRIELDASGLPRLAGGRYYEAWLSNRAGLLVPVGTFNEGRKVTLWAGVSPKQFTSLSVTRERADGDQTSSGERVLAGTVGSSG